MQMVRMVIEVPEEIYQMHKGDDEAFKNAIILPAEHGRLIDADRLDETIMRLNEEDWEITRAEYKRIDGVVFEMPTVVPATGEES